MEHLLRVRNGTQGNETREGTVLPSWKQTTKAGSEFREDRASGGTLKMEHPIALYLKAVVF